MFPLALEITECIVKTAVPFNKSLIEKICENLAVNTHYWGVLRGVLPEFGAFGVGIATKSSNTGLFPATVFALGDWGKELLFQ